VWSACTPRSVSNSSTSRSESEYRRYQRTAHRIGSGAVCRHLKIAGRVGFFAIASRYQPLPPKLQHIHLNLRFESPRPQSRLQFTDAGIEVVVRYPVPLMASAQAADDITRRLIDTLNREPGLRLVAQSNPALQRAAASSDGAPSSTEGTVTPSSSSDSAAPSSAAPAPDANVGITPAAAAAAGAAGTPLPVRWTPSRSTRTAVRRTAQILGVAALAPVCTTSYFALNPPRSVTTGSVELERAMDFKNSKGSISREIPE
jgi:hypothetical protein